MEEACKTCKGVGKLRGFHKTSKKFLWWEWEGQPAYWESICGVCNGRGYVKVEWKPKHKSQIQLPKNMIRETGASAHR
jgi:DnaJ-class molecular chaperone